jgi:hypothetical protein
MSKKKIVWKFEHRDEPIRKKPAWEDEHSNTEKLEVVFEPKEVKPTAMEIWLGDEKDDEEQN